MTDAATSATLITETLLHQWADQGSGTVKAKLVDALKTLQAGGDDGEKKTANARQTLHRLLYELLWVALNAKLSRQDVLSLLKDAELNKSRIGCDLLLDLLWVIGNEVEVKERGRERHSSSEWQALTRFVRDLADQEIVSALHLKSALEVDVLHQAGLLPAPAVMSKKLIRVNTKTYYTQIKFNLLREESEGFAKVLSLLHTGVTRAQLKASKTDLMSLIGYFDLDANRVLDLTLDAYEMQPRNECFVELLELFKQENIPHVLGFKFQFYKRDATGAGAVASEKSSITPRALYRVAAMLIEKNIIDADALMPHLAPSKEDTVKWSLQYMKEQEMAAKAMGKVNLGGNKTAAATPEEEAAAAEKKRQDDEYRHHNQVYGLIMGMLEIGAHERAFEMMAWFKAQGVDPLTHAPLMAQMCSYVHALVGKLYESRSLKKMGLSGSHSPSGIVSSSKGSSAPAPAMTYIRPLAENEDWLSQLEPVLSTLGAHLHSDSFLLTKVLRLVSAHINQTERGTARDALLQRIVPLITQSFLPSLSLQSCNPSTAFQLWDVLKLYPSDDRYRFYQHWQEAYTSSPALQIVEARCVQETRRIMRRLTADRAKASARSLTHIAHSNPLVVFRTMIQQIQAYDNLIQPVVDSFKFITPLGMDTLSFVLVSELAKSRKSMKADGTNISQYLTSLANFSGSFYRKYPNVELTGLLQYLIQRLQNWESVDLVVLSELLSKMGSCITFEDISTSQLEAHAGGPHLWHEPTDPKLTNRRAIPRLRDALIKRDLALPLCLLICQVRSRMEFQEDSQVTHLKALGRMYDTSQMTLSQLLQFLNGVVDPASYTKMLPSVYELVHDYHILPELAMTLCRPSIRSEDAVFKNVARSVHAPGGGAGATGTSTVSNGTTAADGTTAGPKSWDMQSPELLSDIARALSVSSAKDPFVGMTNEMYVTFWSLILYDIYIPFQQYEAEITRMRNSLSTGGNNVTAAERKKLKEKTSQMIDKLLTEQKDQVAHRKRVFERLEAKKNSFFKVEVAESQTAVNELLQKCIIPRALLSPEDALYCAKFMERVHHLNVPSFLTLQYYHKVALQLPSIVLCVTEREAGNFGIFLKETLGLLQRWYQSSVTYEEEAIHGKTGFSIDATDPEKLLSHRQFKNVYGKWHRGMVTLYGKTLASGEYMPIRNSLIVLTKVIDVFPSGKTAAECLLAIVEHLTHEEREDIKIMARRYFALLTKRKGSLIEDKLLAAGLTLPVRESPVTATKTLSVDGVAGEEHSTSKSAADADSDRVAMEPDRDTKAGKEAKRNGRRDRRTPSASRDDLESGEVASDSKGKRESRSKLKRRDSDKVPSSPVAADGPADEKQERRGRGRDRDGARNRGGESKRTVPSRSRSAENTGRRGSREREKGSKGKDSGDTSVTNGGESGRGAGVAPEAETASKDQNNGGKLNKRQRVEETEAALRRQLTEKKGQSNETRRGDTPASSQGGSSGMSGAGGEKDGGSNVQSGNASSRRDTVRTPPADTTAPTTPTGQRKIVSLVSSASTRKRDRESTGKDAMSGAGAGRGNDAVVPEPKRRRENAGGNGNTGNANNKNANDGRDDREGGEGEKKKPFHNRHQQQKQRNDGGGGGGRGGQHQQQRDQGRGRQDQRGGQHRENQGNNNRGNNNNNNNNNGNNGNDRRRDSHNNGDRRGGRR